MNPVYHIYEQIDRYLRKELSDAELAEFNAKLAVDEELKELVDAQRVANRAIVDRELFNLKQRMAQDFNDGKLPSATNWPRIIGIVSVVILSASFLIYKLTDASESESRKNDKNAEKISTISTSEQTEQSSNSSEDVKKAKVISSKGSVKENVVTKDIVLSLAAPTEVQEESSSSMVTTSAMIETSKEPKESLSGKSESKSMDCHSVKISAETKVYYDASSNEATIIIDRMSLKGGTAPYSYALDEDEFSANSTFNFVKEGSYKIKIKDGNNCISILPEKVIVKIPAKEIDDVFTPSHGERWKFPVKKDSDGTISIFNKGGALVYKVSFAGGYPEEWDGSTNNGVELESGNYYFVIQYSGGEILKGHVSITR